MKKILGFVKRNKILLSGATILMIVALLGIQVTPVPIPKTTHAVSIGSGQKYEVTIADKVLAAGLSADYTCNGTNDNVVWQNAINSVPANGGIVNDLTGGLYVFAATVNVPAKVTINGIGRASYFSNNGVTPIFTSTGNGTVYQNISTDNGGINTGATTGWLETNVAVGTTLYTERSPNSSLVDNTFTGNVSATTVGATTLNAPTGRTASYVIAASDAPAIWKAQADYVCTTTDISPAISAGITVIGANGIIHISPTVTATFGATVVLPDMSGSNSTITIEGSGIVATTITLSGNNDMFTTTGTYSRVMFKDMMIQGAAKAYSFFNGVAYFSTFQNLNIYNFGIAGIIETKTDASTWIQNCHFNECGTVATSASGCIVLGTSSGVHIRDNEFDTSARGIKFKDNANVGSIDIQGNRFGSGITNGFYIECEWFIGIDILNNRFEITPGTVTAINIPNVNTKNSFSLNIQNNVFEAMTTLTVPIINFVKGGRALQDINICNNKWDVANLTVPSCIYFDTNGGVYDSVKIVNNTIRSDGATVTNGFVDLTSGALLDRYSQVSRNYSSAVLLRANPIGLAPAPFIDSISIICAFYAYGSGSPTSAQIYYIMGTDCFITSAGGTVTNITIKDSAGNTMLTGVTTLTNQFVPIGYSVTWTHTGAPTVTVFGN